MRRGIAPAIGLAILLGAGAAAIADRGEKQNARAHLTGAAERPVARETTAVGQTVLHVDKTGEELSYKLIASDIENVVAAHIHRGGTDQAGPVVAFLYGAVPAGGGRHDGVLAEGVITGEDLVGPLAGQDLDVLLSEIRNGNAYVNVHTNDGVGDVNTGPGDFPGGEIRGQIVVGGPPQ